MKKNKTFKNLFLILICAHDGEYTWYQLERELELRGIAGRFRASDIVELLLVDSCVVQDVGSGGSEAMPVYSITDLGRARARELVSEYGVEIFKAQKQDPDEYVLQ